MIVAGLDTRFSFSVAGVQVRRAMRRGARLVVVDARESNLARVADDWLRPRPGDEAHALAELVRTLDADGPGRVATGPASRGQPVAASREEPQRAPTTAVVIGPRVFDCEGAEELPFELEALAARGDVSILPLAHGANVRGVLELGVLGGVAPGPRPATGRAAGDATGRTPDLAELRAGRVPKVLYLVGEAPFATRPELRRRDRAGSLPAAVRGRRLPAGGVVRRSRRYAHQRSRVAFRSCAPSSTSREGASHGFARPDWRIFSDLAARLGRSDLQLCRRRRRARRHPGRRSRLRG